MVSGLLRSCPARWSWVLQELMRAHGSTIELHPPQLQPSFWATSFTLLPLDLAQFDLISFNNRALDSDYPLHHIGLAILGLKLLNM